MHIKENHAGSTCETDPNLRIFFPYSHPRLASGGEERELGFLKYRERLSKDTHSHR